MICAHCDVEIWTTHRDHEGLCCDCFDLSCGQPIEQLNQERKEAGRPPIVKPWKPVERTDHRDAKYVIGDNDAAFISEELELTALRAQLEAARKEVQEAHLETLSAFGENEAMGERLQKSREAIAQLSNMLREMQVWVTGHDERTREYANKDRKRIAALLSEYGDE